MYLKSMNLYTLWELVQIPQPFQLIFGHFRPRIFQKDPFTMVVHSQFWLTQFFLMSTLGLDHLRVFRENNFDIIIVDLLLSQMTAARLTLLA